MEEGHPDLKVVLVGPPDSGKSSMILSLTSDAYKNISEHTPTVFDTYRARIGDSDGQTYQLRCRSNTELCNFGFAASGTQVWTPTSERAHFRELTPS